MGTGSVDKDGRMNIDSVLERVRGCIRTMHGYVPGKQPAEGRYVKLNTNENPYPPSPVVLEALRQAVNEDLRYYSDPLATPLREEAARHYGCAPDEVVVGNGSDDVLTMIFRTFLDAGDALVTPSPSYSLYQVLGNLQAADYREIPMGPGYTLPEGLDACDAKLVFIVNPNAPTGVLHPAGALRDLLGRSKSLVVLDEAYADFAGHSAIEMLSEFPNLIVVRTFSKSYALAGMRLGLGFARREVIAQMMKVKDSYNLDRLAIVAGCAALRDQGWLRETTDRIIATRAATLEALTGMGLHVPPSRANFVFPRIPDGRAFQVHQALEERRILVRYFNAPLVADSLRVTIGTDEEMTTFTEALKTLL